MTVALRVFASGPETPAVAVERSRVRPRARGSSERAGVRARCAVAVSREKKNAIIHIAH